MNHFKLLSISKLLFLLFICQQSIGQHKSTFERGKSNWFNPSDNQKASPTFYNKHSTANNCYDHITPNGKGNGYVGLIVYQQRIFNENYREYISANINLEKNRAYNFTIKVTTGSSKQLSCNEWSSAGKYFIKGLAIGLSINRPKQIGFSPMKVDTVIYLTPQIIQEKIAKSDKTLWDTFPLRIVPTQNYQYISVGVFGNDEAFRDKKNKNYQLIESTSPKRTAPYAYYFFDNIQLNERKLSFSKSKNIKGKKGIGAKNISNQVD